MHVPRVMTLNPTANGIAEELLIEGRSVSSNSSEGVGQKGAVPKKDPKKVENPNVKTLSLTFFYRVQFAVSTSLKII
jgi:hypothetical protein